MRSFRRRGRLSDEADADSNIPRLVALLNRHCVSAPDPTSASVHADGSPTRPCCARLRVVGYASSVAGGCAVAYPRELLPAAVLVDQGASTWPWPRFRPMAVRVLGSANNGAAAVVLTSGGAGAGLCLLASLGADLAAIGLGVGAYAAGGLGRRWDLHGVVAGMGADSCACVGSCLFVGQLPTMGMLLDAWSSGRKLSPVSIGWMTVTPRAPLTSLEASLMSHMLPVDDAGFWTKSPSYVL